MTTDGSSSDASTATVPAARRTRSSLTRSKSSRCGVSTIHRDIAIASSMRDIHRELTTTIYRVAAKSRCIAYERSVPPRRSRPAETDYPGGGGTHSFLAISFGLFLVAGLRVRVTVGIQ